MHQKCDLVNPPPLTVRGPAGLKAPSDKPQRDVRQMENQLLKNAQIVL